MTVGQVGAASKHLAVEASPDESAAHSASDGSQITKLVAPYSSGKFQFTAYLGFDQNGKLSGVSLQLVSGDPHQLIGALRGKYGKPASEDPAADMSAWLWYAGGDRIQVLMIGDLVTLSYGPRHEANEKGL